MATPRIVYEGDGEAAHRHLPVAQNLLHKVREIARTTGSGVNGQSFSPDADSIIYVLKVGDTEVIHIYSAPSTSEQVVNPPQFLPNVLSGTVRNGDIVEVPAPLPDNPDNVTYIMKTFKPTPQCAKFVLGTPDKPAPSSYTSNKRLVVRPWSAFSEFSIQDPNGKKTQYAFIKPSMYSGRMCKLVQFVLGYGKLNPAVVMEFDSTTQKAFITDGVQLRFDYRWFRTHGLYKGTDGTNWLVEISQNNGVIAMPLSLYKLSTKGAQGSKYEMLINSEQDVLREAALEFGGLPTGLAFPSGDALKKAMAKGDIIQLAPAAALRDYFFLDSYSTAMGWSFNESGSEAHNTGWYFHADGIRRGLHYRLDIQIGNVVTARTKDQPIATGFAKLTKVSEGYVYHPSKSSPPPIKFYEPMLPGLLSVDMRAALKENADGSMSAPDTNVACDTTMHVCHFNGQLSLVNYYWDRAYKTGGEDHNDYTPCMGPGQYTDEWIMGTYAVPPMFYSSDVDDRAATTPDFGTTKTTVTDIGYSREMVNDDLADIRYAYVTRAKRFRNHSVAIRNSGAWLGSAVVIPDGARDAYAYYFIKGINSSIRTESVGYSGVLDPYAYKTFRYFYFKPQGGGCFNQFDRVVQQELFQDGGANAADGTAWPVACSDLANSGSWHAVCDKIPEPGPNDHSPNFPAPWVKVTDLGNSQSSVYGMLFTNTEFGSIKLPVTPDDAGKWFAASPGDLGLVQDFVCQFSAFGAPHIVHSNNINTGGPARGYMTADEENPCKNSINYIGYL